MVDPSAAPADTALGQVPDRLDLRPGESVSFALGGLATAGYQWEHTLAGPSGVVALDWSRGWVLGEQQAATAAAAGPGGAETLTVAAQAPGSVQLSLAQRRPWESVQDVAAYASHRIEITVQDQPLTDEPVGDQPAF